MKKRIVVALGGNAILSDDPTAKAQMDALRYTSEKLVGLIKQGYQLVISHGNGPQVGNLLLQQSAADSEENPALPLDTLVAMTQGSIGYWLQNTLKEKLISENVEKQVASIVTQVVVDEYDPAFDNLTKPVGPFLTEEAAKRVSEETGEPYKYFLPNGIEIAAQIKSGDVKTSDPESIRSKPKKPKKPKRPERPKPCRISEK